MGFTVTYGVKGAVRISVKTFHTLVAAEAFADRWRSSNSTGDYWARVTRTG